MSAVEATSAGFFEKSLVPPPVGSTEFSLEQWEKTRDAGIKPEFHSGYADSEQHRLEFLEGARLMGYLRPGESLKPQQLQISDTLASPLSAFVVEVPRRATKTTSIFLVLLGRCALRPGYKVTFSAQSGIAGSRQFLDWAMQLDSATPPNDLYLPPWLRGRPAQISKGQQRQQALFGDDFAPTGEANLTGGRGFRIMKGEVNKGIYFDNGSSFVVLKPDGAAYRGRAADASWLDEAQEIPVEDGDDLLAAIRPLQDTRPGASLILSGTAGEVRVGVFWDYLSRGRARDSRIGIIDFAAPEDTAWEEFAPATNDAAEVRRAEDSAMKLLQRVHPGINTLTTLEIMRDRYRDLARPKWAREYLSIWPETAGSLAINPELWNDAGLSRKIARPERVAFGSDIKPGGSAGAIVAAWRNSRGVAYIEIVAHQSGTQWMPKREQELTTRYRGSSIAYDDIGEGKATALETNNLPGARTRLRVQTYSETAAGCVQIMRDLERGKLKHFHQAGLDEAVEHAAKRMVRGESGLWLWTPVDRERGDDITPLVAATRALRNWDQNFARKQGPSQNGIVSAS